MTASKSLPARPSLESLRKQAKKLARDVAAGDAAAIARTRAQAPDVALPLTQRNAQLVIAREYGHAGWQELTAEASKRLGKGLEWAVEQARRIIHDNDVEGLKRLLAEYPALLSWQADEEDDGLVGMATGAYGDAGDAQREEWFTRGACAELLVDAGATVMPSVCEGLLRSRARGLLELFQRKGLLPRTMNFLAALGDLEAVRVAIDENGKDLAIVTNAFLTASRFKNEAVASFLLERAVSLDPDLRKRIDDSVGRSTFLERFLEEKGPSHAADGLWKAFVMERLNRAMHDGDRAAFVDWLQREPWVLGEDYVSFQNGLIETASYNERGQFITALLDFDPAILRRQPPPHSHAIEYAVTYAETDLVPVLTRIWPLPDDLPHAAGMGDLARVKRWFDETGAPALGDVDNHFPHKGAHKEAYDTWGVTPTQKVLDTALAWSVINRHFDVADFLLAHGADLNTRWNSHEPASILHHLTSQKDSYESMQYLMDCGIDMTIEDYRWKSNARGWALYGMNDPKMAKWLEDAERERKPIR